LYHESEALNKMLDPLPVERKTDIILFSTLTLLISLFRLPDMLNIFWTLQPFLMGRNYLLSFLQMHSIGLSVLNGIHFWPKIVSLTTLI